MDQHVISRWLLRAFAGGSDRDLLVAYDKTIDDYRSTSPRRFLVEVDAHSKEVEQGIEAIETPASAAARRLSKRVRRLRPGLYALVDETEEARTSGNELEEVGLVQGVRLFVTHRQLPQPSLADRRALAAYIGLMYQRAPKVEASMIKWGKAFDEAAQAALDIQMPGFRTGLETLVQARRSRMLATAPNIGTRLVSSNWFIVRPADDESFVLGDCPVVATISLGHDDTWRAIFSEESFVVVMPLGPKVALLISPSVIPVTNIEPADLTRTINRLMWRSADRYVLARSRTDLEAALPGADAAERTATVEVDLDIEQVRSAAMESVDDVVAAVRRRRIDAGLRATEVPWGRWDGCRLILGDRQPWLHLGKSALLD